MAVKLEEKDFMLQQAFYENVNFVQQIAASGQQLIDKQSVEQLVALEMEKLRALYDAEETAYVQDQFKLNPIVEQRRPSQPGADPKRAEACRRSRYNGKVKKASLRYRHYFMAHKLRDSGQILQNMRDMVNKMENALLTDSKNRIDEATLKNLKIQFGLEKPLCDINSLINIEID